MWKIACDRRLELDRARVQVGKISRFGLLEMSRQRLTLWKPEQKPVPVALVRRHDSWCRILGTFHNETHFEEASKTKQVKSRPLSGLSRILY